MYRTREYDIVVCGGGSAGFCAAVQAARTGCRTALVERYGMPGGIMTVMGNNAVAQFHAHKKQVIHGIGWDFLLELERRGYANIPDMTLDGPHWRYGVDVNIVAAAQLMDEWLLESGVDIYYSQPVVDVEKASGDDGRLTGVIISTKGGLLRLTADMFVDCTGDGDVCAWAGASYECGEEGSGELQPGTLKLYYDKAGLSPEARSEELKHTYHIKDYNGADSDSRTRAEIDARRQAYMLMEKLRANPLTSDIRVVNCAPEVATRETRRITGEGYITMDDYVSGRFFEDAICYSFYPIDLHMSHGDKSIFQIHLKEPLVPTIPLSALIVKGFSNLLVAGRCASGDRYANSAYRVKASCMAMGQAAGATAATAVKQSKADVRGADIEAIKTLLAENNAIIPKK
ncbi:MAG: FAD-dependent oxidoreductase [Eubacteriales bacterium]